MKKQIGGQPKTLRVLLTGVKYTVHYYQREYMWGKKQIEELIEDLTEEFLEQYDETHERIAVKGYGHYFMGSIVVTENDNAIIDGQQRLTSLTLLLIYLHHLQKDRPDQSRVKNIEQLIFSEQYGQNTYNVDVPERRPCLDALFLEKEDFQVSGQPESVRNLVARYHDIVELFPEELKGEALPYFTDWLIDKVDFIEITAQTEQDAHKVFVTMNDRGLSLTPTEMLKGFLLSEIADNDKRNKANEVWKEKILLLKDLGKEEDANFIKTFLRAQYADTIRDSKKDAENKDWDIIGNPFHKWLRENSTRVGLRRSADFEEFILETFTKFARTYIRLIQYSRKLDSRFPHVFYNADRYLTLQNQVILAAIDPADTDDMIDRKIRLVSCYLDQFITCRIFNFKTIDYNAIKGQIFSLTKEVRRQPVDSLKTHLKYRLENMEVSLAGMEGFYLNGFTKRYMLHLLARLTSFIEQQSGRHTDFDNYISREIANPYDIEHILPNQFDADQTDFSDEREFQTYRNFFGALLLLPRDKNRSYQAKPYSEKVLMYDSENLLARTLHPNCYLHNPQFLQFYQAKRLPFRPIQVFGKMEVLERQGLYKEIASVIWNPNDLLNF